MVKALFHCQGPIRLYSVHMRNIFCVDYTKGKEYPIINARTLLSQNRSRALKLLGKMGCAGEEKKYGGSSNSSCVVGGGNGCPKSQSFFSGVNLLGNGNATTMQAARQEEQAKVI